MNDLAILIAGAHNDMLISKAEKIINNMLEDGNSILYLVNPDKKAIKIHHGCKFVFAQCFGGQNDKT